jgi:hypothetical protein
MTKNISELRDKMSPESQSRAETKYHAMSAFEQIDLQIENAMLRDYLRHQYVAAVLTGLLSNASLCGKYDDAGYAAKALRLADAAIAATTQRASSDVQPTPANFAI